MSKNIKQNLFLKKEFSDKGLSYQKPSIKYVTMRHRGNICVTSDSPKSEASFETYIIDKI